MANYKISDLINALHEIASDNYEYVDILELDEDDDMPASLSFSAISDSFSEVDYESVDSVEIPENYDSETSSRLFAPSDICPDLLFTFDEIFTLKQALDNALEYMKECSKDPSCSRETLEDIKANIIITAVVFFSKCRRNYFIQFLSIFGILAVDNHRNPIVLLHI